MRKLVHTFQCYIPSWSRLKHIVLLLLVGQINLVAVAQTERIVLPLRIAQGEPFRIPEKVDRLDMQKLSWSPQIEGAATEAVDSILRQIDLNDYQYYTFALEVERISEGQMNVKVYNFDVLTADDTQRRMYFGDMKVGRAHFIVAITPTNLDFIKQAFRRANGKTQFERVYERVPEETLMQSVTKFLGLWNGTQLVRKEFIINDEDQLTTKTITDYDIPVVTQDDLFQTDSVVKTQPQLPEIKDNIQTK